MLSLIVDDDDDQLVLSKTARTQNRREEKGVVQLFFFWRRISDLKRQRIRRRRKSFSPFESFVASFNAVHSSSSRVDCLAKKPCPRVARNFNGQLMLSFDVTEQPVFLLLLLFFRGLMTFYPKLQYHSCLHCSRLRLLFTVHRVCPTQSRFHQYRFPLFYWRLPSFSSSTSIASLRISRG